MNDSEFRCFEVIDMGAIVLIELFIALQLESLLQIGGIGKSPLAGLAALGLGGLAPANTGGLNPAGMVFRLL